MKNARVTYNSDKFQEKAAQLLKELRTDQIDEILRHAAQSFVTYSATRSNPNGGSKNIADNSADWQKIYLRPVLFLPKLVRGEIKNFYATGEDLEMLRKGFLFKVVKTKGRRTETFAYCKTYADALQAARIKNRGLLRVMWGLNSEQAGIPMNKVVQNVLQWNPEAGDHSELNDFEFGNLEQGRFLEITNDADVGPNSSGYKKYLASIGMQYAAKTIGIEVDYLLRKLADQWEADRIGA